MAEQQAVEQPATESAPQDLDSLLEAKFGDPEVAEPTQPEGEQEAAPEEADEGEVSEAPEFVEVEFSGNKYQVPPELKDALMAQADYTAKTTEVANTRRALEIQQKEIALFQEQRAFEESIGADSDRLKMMDAYIQHTKSNTNWASLTTDQIVRARLEIDQLAEQRNELANALKAKREEFSQKLSGERSKLKESAKELLTKAIPSWNDETRASVEKYAQSMGYPETVVPNMSALDYQVLWKAQQYDKVRAETKGAVKRASEAPVITPTARKNPMPQKVRTKLDLKNAVKAGKNVDAALDKRLEQMFGG
jgi:hypothetical protein